MSDPAVPTEQPAAQANFEATTLRANVEGRERRNRERRAHVDRGARRKVEGFMTAFEGAGLSDDRLQHARTVPLARNIIGVGRSISDKITSADKAVSSTLKTQCDNIYTKVKATPKNIVIPPPVIIGVLTFAVALDAFKGVLRNLAEGFIEGIMKISGAFSDALQQHYRSKFKPTNDLQEITIALVFFLGCLVTSISAFLGSFWAPIKNFFVQIVEKFLGKDCGSLASHGWDIIFVYIQIRLIFHFATPKIIIIAALILTIISFFLKMDDLPGGAESPANSSTPIPVPSSSSSPSSAPAAAASSDAPAVPHETSAAAEAAAPVVEESKKDV